MDASDADPTLVADATIRTTGDGLQSSTTVVRPTERATGEEEVGEEKERATIRAAVMGWVLALLVVGAFGYDAFMRSVDAGLQPEVAPVGVQTETAAVPPGETIEVLPEAEPAAARGLEESAARPVESRIPRNGVDGESSGGVSVVAALPPHVVTAEPEGAAADPAAPLTTHEATDTIPGIGRPLFGRRSTRLTDSAEYRADFRSGIIRDYGDMWSRGGCDWASVAEGVQLADFAITVSPFINLTDLEADGVRHWLEANLQDELDGIAGSAGKLSTENAIFLASDGPDAAIGIEMIFRD
jgi:hypothetical protein